MYRTQLHWQPIVLLVIITMIWGSNMAFVKIASREMAPIFIAGLRFEKPILRLYLAALPFIAILLLALAVITYVPWLSLVLIQ